jgi:tetratricopeptide (TPR) repeat protein
MNGITPPLERLEHLDVLQIARKLWRDRLPSRALQELEKDVVRYHRTSQEVPGWLIPQLYFNYLTTGEAAPLAGVFYHNARDLLTLAALYSHIAEMLKDPTGDAVRYGLDLAAIARLYEGMGKIEQAAALYERCLDDGDMPEVFFLKTMGRYAALCRRSGDWQTAAALWQKAAERGEMTACIELSKYYEHRARNDTEALRWAKASLEILDSMRAFPGAFRAAEKEIQRRIGRLQGRVYRVYRARDEER